MSDFKEDLKESLSTGFINHSLISKKQMQPDFILNDKFKESKVLSYILNRIEVCDNFWISAAFLTTSGLASLHNALKVFSDKGKGEGKIYVSDYLTFTQPEALRRIRQFRNIETRILVNKAYHGKGYLFKCGEQFDCLIGSSNLTAQALTSNDELNFHFTASAESKSIADFLKIFNSNFDQASILTDEYLSIYTNKYELKKFSDEEYSKAVDINFKEQEFLENDSSKINKSNQFDGDLKINHTPKFTPNLLQLEATNNLDQLRSEGEEKALVISATGTGKTFLSAFDVKNFNPKRMLFIVHRFRITSKALDTFKVIFGKERTYGFYSHSVKDTKSDFIFSTIQTINKDENLRSFDPNAFDYIVIDETHRAGASSYNKVLDYFKPKFLLGMTATPERTDGYDIFSLFNHNIACEIRLPRAMEEGLVCPFHYFGITDLLIDGEEIEEKTSFNKLVSSERVNHIIEKIDEFGTDDGTRRGLIFCSSVKEAMALANEFNNRGLRSVALSGISSEDERLDVMRRIEAKESPEKLEYIFSVDILNEGIDIPCINQIVMLRPTQSAIVFVQQLGRGLRQAKGKEYLTVIDFIGNYEKNYLIPVALYGDRSLNKDTLRKLVSSKSNIIPGSSTINFDEITKEKIYNSIDGGNLKTKKDLVNDYRILKFRLGREPMMMDFVEHDLRDPFQYIEYNKTDSFYNFSYLLEGENLPHLDEFGKKLLEKICKLVNNGIRGLESLLLLELIENEEVNISSVISKYQKITKSDVDKETFNSAVNVLNLKFNTEIHKKKLTIVADIYDYEILVSKGDLIQRGSSLSKALANITFKKYIKDSSEYSLHTFMKNCGKSILVDGFVRYAKYKRTDVFRILNFNKEPVGLNVGGYMKSKDNTNCALFVRYNKPSEISDTINYEDKFLSPELFCHISKNSRNLKSPEVILWTSQKKNKVRIPLFVKKSDDEGEAHYYIGDLTYIEGSAKEQKMSGESGKDVVNCSYKIDEPVEENLYTYLTSDIG